MSGVMAQNVGNWNFNSTLSGTAASNATVSVMSVGSAIPTLTTNNTIEYYGEGGWPAGTLDANAYLQFTLSPGTGYYLVLNTMKMAMRRSSTGSPAGSGPNSWSLRSSLDNYATDLASYTNMDYNTVNYSVSLPAAFQTLTSAITFRIYGYNTTVTSTGISRFVWDNISVAGSVGSGVLASLGVDLRAGLRSSGDVSLNWTSTGFSAGAVYELQRSVNGSDFSTVYEGLEAGAAAYAYEDRSVPAAARVYYRIAAANPDGSQYISPIVSVAPGDAGTMRIRGVVAQSGTVKALVHVAGGSYQLGIWSQDGKSLLRQVWTAGSGDGTADLSIGTMPHGVYVLTLAGEGTRVSRAFVL